MIHFALAARVHFHEEDKRFDVQIDRHRIVVNPVEARFPFCELLMYDPDQTNDQIEWFAVYTWLSGFGTMYLSAADQVPASFANISFFNSAKFIPEAIIVTEVQSTVRVLQTLRSRRTHMPRNIDFITVHYPKAAREAERRRDEELYQMLVVEARFDAEAAR